MNTKLKWSDIDWADWKPLPGSERTEDVLKRVRAKQLRERESDKWKVYNENLKKMIKNA